MCMTAFQPKQATTAFYPATNVRNGLREATTVSYLATNDRNSSRVRGLAEHAMPFTPIVWVILEATSTPSQVLAKCSHSSE